MPARVRQAAQRRRLGQLLGARRLAGPMAAGLLSLLVLYADGVIHRRNGRVRAFTWAEVVELRAVVGTKGDRAGKLAHYKLTPQGARPFLIPVRVIDGRDEFLDRLIAALRRHGRPVVTP